MTDDFVAQAREEAPVQLDRLSEINPRAADFIADVYSEVFAQLRNNDIKDPVMVEWLMEALAYHLLLEADHGS